VVVVGVDFAPKHDAAAIAAIVRMKDMTAALLDLIVRHGSRKSPLPADWVTETILGLVSRYGMVKIMADPLGILDQLTALRLRGLPVIECNRKGPQIADRLYRAIGGRRLRLYHDAGVVETFDGRRYGLTDELSNLQLDTETGKIGHFGEGTQPGRNYDDRCTAIGLALQAPELDVTGIIQGVPVAAILPPQAEHGVATHAAHQLPVQVFARGTGPIMPGGMRPQIDIATGMLPGFSPASPHAANCGFSKRPF
jgi:hypothetical protein